MFDDIQRGPAGYLTTPEAASMLSVSVARVRDLAARRELPAIKLGREWLIEKAAVERRMALEPRAGRRFTPARAWGLLFVADGMMPDWLSPQDRWRLSRFIPRLRAGDLRAQMVDRGRARPFRAHPGLLDGLRSDDALMVTGVSASVPLRLGLIGGDDGVEAYVSENALEDVVRRHYLRPTDDVNVVLRVVPCFGWAWPELRVAPSAAVALDLLDSPEPRARQVGQELLRSGVR
ncbi:MAG: helix-turn-helix domain-containing protein [Chloroflexota bacterium]